MRTLLLLAYCMAVDVFMPLLLAGSDLNPIRPCSVEMWGLSREFSVIINVYKKLPSLIN